jgi:hypothetical protein
MYNQSAHLTRALVKQHRRDALERARDHRLTAALRWERRAAKAAARAQRARESL